MDEQLIKANINLYAVLKNLEDLVVYDSETASLIEDWEVSIQFNVLNGPEAWIEFKNGICTFHRGKRRNPSVILLFTSAAHFNRMMDGKENPIPLKGLAKLGFLEKDFTKITEKLEYYLKPTNKLLESETYLELNTRFTLNTATFAIKELALLDPIGKVIASRMGNGGVNVKVLPNGPSVYVNFRGEDIEPGKGELETPMAFMSMKNVKVANDFLAGKIDEFTAIASGDVMIKGQIQMLQSMSLILDRIVKYVT
jgi:hypothetical protein